MPCKALLHVHGRIDPVTGQPYILDPVTGLMDWAPGDIVAICSVKHKFRGKDNKSFQPVIIPHWTVEEGMKYQGRGRGRAALDDMHADPSDRARMRNKKVNSPVPKNLKAEHFTKGPMWGKPRKVSE